MAAKTQQQSRAIARWTRRGKGFAARLIAVVPEPIESFVLRCWVILFGRRVAGLAAEAAFWAVFSLPWILMAFVVGLGITTRYVGDQAVNEVRETFETLSSRLLTPEAATQYVDPIINEIFSETRTDLGILSLVIAIYSGSRAVMTFVDAIMIVNGEYGSRGYLKRRLLAVFIYLVGALVAFILIPVVAAGPRLIGEWIQASPLMVGLTAGFVAFFASVGLLMFMFHFAGVKRLRWTRSAPGALFALVGCSIGTIEVSIYVRGVFNNSSVYGFLAMPVALMIFAYVLSYIVLLGAVINAVINDRPIFADNYNPRDRYARVEALLAIIEPHPPDEGVTGEAEEQDDRPGDVKSGDVKSGDVRDSDVGAEVRP